MFENLQEKLQRAFKNLRGQGTLTPENIQEALKEIRLALLEADVNFKVVKQLIDQIQAKAIGTEVMTALSPAQQVVKIVHDELIEILGRDTAKLKFVAEAIKANLYEGKVENADTATVERLAKEARKEAMNTGCNFLIVDTAGRLHIDDDLMSEMQSLKKLLNPQEILFIADAMTGQDAVRSADEFHKKLSITGVILTKMDGDARGGAALSIRQVTGQPIKF